MSTEHKYLCFCPACDVRNEATQTELDTGLKCCECGIGFIPANAELILQPTSPPRQPLANYTNRSKIIVGGIAAILIGLLVISALLNPLGDAREILGGWGLVLLGLVLYFLPAYVARKRKHRNSEAIAVLNLLAGWTGVGWIVALVWAYTNAARD